MKLLREREWRLKQSHQKLGKKLCPSVWRSVGLAAALITDADLEASLNPAARDEVLRDDVVQLRTGNVIWMGIYFLSIKCAVPIPIRTIPIPIPIPISSPKLLPFPWKFHGNGNIPIPMHTSISDPSIACVLRQK